MHALKRNRDRDAWPIAWALTLALHAGVILGFHPTLEPAATTFRKPQPIQLVFSKPATEARRTGEPRFFSELPPDRSDAAPDQVDFLSNVTSRARDQVPGGDDALPRMQGEADAPMVKLEPSESPPLPPAASLPAPQPTEPATSSSGASPIRSGAPERDPTGFLGARVTSPKSHELDAARASDEAFSGRVGSTGNTDFHQPEMANPHGNAPMSAGVSLNTTAWDYAPWLQRFARQLVGRWFAPPAYYMRILKDGGWATIEVEISRSGKLVRMELLEEQGHASLILAAQSALRSMAPIEPLPADFPEETLILRVRMIYPMIRPR